MEKINKVHITKDQKDFLELIMHGDASNSIGGGKGELGNAVQWCIDACMKIEKRYGIDACYVAHNDIRYPENDEQSTSKRMILLVDFNRDSKRIWIDPNLPLGETSIESLTCGDIEFKNLKEFVASNPLPGKILDQISFYATCVLRDKS